MLATAELLNEPSPPPQAKDRPRCEWREQRPRKRQALWVKSSCTCNCDRSAPGRRGRAWPRPSWHLGILDLEERVLHGQHDLLQQLPSLDALRSARFSHPFSAKCSAASSNTPTSSSPSSMATTPRSRSTGSGILSRGSTAGASGSTSTASSLKSRPSGRGGTTVAHFP